MKKLTKEQEQVRDAEIDWELARLCRHAQHQAVWRDYSPTSNWREAGVLIEQYQIDIRYFNKDLHPDLEYEWMGGVTLVSKKTKLLTYYNEFGPTPLIASMKTLVKALQN